MEGFRYVDIFSTKGIEYLIVIGFLSAFIIYSRYLRANRPAAEAKERAVHLVEWFRVPEGYLFHQGHSWLRPEGNDVVTVGWDDFAQKMVGRVDAVSLPAIGSRLRQGEKGWELRVEDRIVPMISPVDGEVVAVNPNVLGNPDVAHRDPYGQGWLMMVRSPRIRSNARNLLSGKLARQWMENALGTLRAESGGALGTVYQDGGLPVDGIARALYGANWEGHVRRFFLTASEP